MPKDMNGMKGRAVDFWDLRERRMKIRAEADSRARQIQAWVIGIIRPWKKAK